MKVYKQKLYLCYNSKQKAYYVVKPNDLMGAFLQHFFMKMSFMGLRVSRRNACRTKYKRKLTAGDIVTERTGLRFKVLNVIDEKL